MAAREKPPAPHTLIALSGAEVAFLRKVTNGLPRDLDDSPEIREALHRRLAELKAEGSRGSDRYLFPVDRHEIDQLHRITKSAYCFITEGERRARLVLREKMVVASGELGFDLP